MQQSETIMFMQSLRGNQPLIVLAFLLVRSALSIEQLEIYTGLHNDTVRGAVKGLSAKGLLYKQVGQHGRQMWLPVGGTFFAKLFDQNPKTSDSTYDVVVVESEERQLNKLTASTTGRQNPKTSDSTLSEEEKECLAALSEAGIRGKKAHGLLALEWVTAEYVRAHFAKVQTEDWDNPPGMMIYRMEGGEPAPEFEAMQPKRADMKNAFREMLRERELLDEEEHAEDCECITCKRQFPERFCAYKMPMPKRYGHGITLSGECGALVEAGRRYCKNHLEFESEEE